MESEGNQNKKGNIRGVSELIRVAGLLTHHLCQRLCRARDKAQSLPCKGTCDWIRPQCLTPGTKLVFLGETRHLQAFWETISLPLPLCWFLVILTKAWVHLEEELAPYPHWVWFQHHPNTFCLHMPLITSITLAHVPYFSFPPHKLWLSSARWITKKMIF